MPIACNDCGKQHSEEARVTVRYHPDKICCRFCGSENVAWFDEAWYEDAVEGKYC